ncbi:MAG: hypothetical protein ACM37W_18525 [Actinomycetota bacterium]
MSIELCSGFQNPCRTPAPADISVFRNGNALRFLRIVFAVATSLVAALTAEKLALRLLKSELSLPSLTQFNIIGSGIGDRLSRLSVTGGVRSSSSQTFDK